MGQAMNKLAGKNVEPEKQRQELDRMITAYMDKHFADFETEMRDRGPNENLFYHFIYQTVEGVNEACGAMQYKLPKFTEFQKIFKEAHPDATVTLTKQELQKIILKVVGIDNLYFGQGFKDIVLYTIGFPTVSLLIKRMIFGANSPISDEVFIPLATSATVVYLAKSNKL